MKSAVQGLRSWRSTSSRTMPPVKKSTWTGSIERTVTEVRYDLACAIHSLRPCRFAQPFSGRLDTYRIDYRFPTGSQEVRGGHGLCNRSQRLVVFVREVSSPSDGRGRSERGG